MQVRENSMSILQRGKTLRSLRKYVKGFIIEANIGRQGQGCLPISLYTLYWDFKIIPFALYTYVLAKIYITKWCEVYTKNQLLV